MRAQPTTVSGADDLRTNKFPERGQGLSALREVPRRLDSLVHAEDDAQIQMQEARREANWMSQIP